MERRGVGEEINHLFEMWGLAMDAVVLSRKCISVGLIFYFCAVV